MKEIKLFAVHHGYEIIGHAETYEECKKLCNGYCKQASGGKVSFELKRSIESFDNDGNSEYALVYQYSTAYLEMFYCTNKFEL